MIFLACIAPTPKAGGLGVLPQKKLNIVDVISCVLVNFGSLIQNPGEIQEICQSRRLPGEGFKIQETPGKSRRVDRPGVV